MTVLVAVFFLLYPFVKFYRDSLRVEGEIMPGGRPTKYSQKMLDDTKDYLENHSLYGDMVPSVVGLACHLKLHTRTLYDWASQPEKHQFSAMFEQVTQIQERLLLSGGLSGQYNPAITKLMLSKHGYSEKTQQEISGTNGGPIQNEFTVNFVNSDKM